MSGRPYQCKRMACRNADRPSMMTRILTVSVNQAAKPPTSAMGAMAPSILKKLASVMSHSTMESSDTPRRRRHPYTHSRNRR